LIFPQASVGGRWANYASDPPELKKIIANKEIYQTIAIRITDIFLISNNS
jgi:hypothetical protein